LPFIVGWHVLRRATPERLSAFSDGVFAVLITVLVLDLRPPERPTFAALTTLCLFGVAAIAALKYPLVGLGICVCCLVAYLRPDPPWAEKQGDGTEET
jgi:hypothetical protein